MNYTSLIFASSNEHKLLEVQKILGDEIDLLSLADLGCYDIIPETSDTFEGNALQKAEYIYNKYGKTCFAEDSGLEVKALDGAPGVYTARYAGEGKDDDDNMDLVLSRLGDREERTAIFVAVIALIFDGEPYFFKGEAGGKIAYEKSGSKGFGYDPIFIPEGYNETFAELGQEVKSKVSHRAQAARKLTTFLQNKYKRYRNF